MQILNCTNYVCSPSYNGIDNSIIHTIPSAPFILYIANLTTLAIAHNKVLQKVIHKNMLDQQTDPLSQTFSPIVKLD